MRESTHEGRHISLVQLGLCRGVVLASRLHIPSQGDITLCHHTGSVASCNCHLLAEAICQVPAWEDPSVMAEQTRRLCGYAGQLSQRVS